MMSILVENPATGVRVGGIGIGNYVIMFLFLHLFFICSLKKKMHKMPGLYNHTNAKSAAIEHNENDFTALLSLSTQY